MGLKYCKRCGENLGYTFQPPQYQNQNQNQRSESGGTMWVAVAAWGLALATVAITLGGFGIIFTHAFDLARPAPPGFTSTGDAEFIAAMMLGLGSVAIFGIVAMLIRVFSKIMGLSPSRAQKEPPPVQRPSVIDYPPAHLSSPPPSISSVTEHTTRNFELPKYKEPQARE